MRQKLYLLAAAFLLFSTYGTAQSALAKEVQPYFGQKGIKKKISELQAVKPLTEKPKDTASVKPMKFRLNKLTKLRRVSGEVPATGATAPVRYGEDEENAALRPAVAAASGGSTQPIWSNFLATDFYDNLIGWPPDCNGDVGPSQVAVVTNLGVKIFEKHAVTDRPLVTSDGYSRSMPASELSLTLDQFFSPVMPNNSYPVDPHVRYDRLSKRWYVVAIEVNPSFQNNLILVAVSDGEKINKASSFTFYSFNSSLFPYNPDAPYAPFLDYPMVGVDKHAVLIGGNQFGYDSIPFVGYVVDKSRLLKGELVVYPFQLGNVDFTKQTITGAVVPQGVHNDDPGALKSFFVGLNAANDGLVVANIAYDKKHKPRLEKENTIRVQPFNYPRDNSSPGGLTPIDQLDTRLFAAAIYKNKLTGTSSLWTAHAIGVNKSGGYINGSDSDYVREARTGSRWYKIGNIYSTPRIFQSGTIYDSVQSSGRRAKQYFNPSIAASGQGHSIVSGTTDAYNEYLNVFAAGRYFGNALGTSKTPVKATNTTAIYAPYIDYGGGFHLYVGRWGDYSQTVVDPLDDQTIWTFQEYANVDDSYGVRAVQFKAPPPATPAAVGTLSNKKDTTITLEGESIDHSGFFDPGKDEGGPGYNRLSVKATGSITVSNVKFISPTKISFRLNTANKPAGDYLLIIINPDGQLVVTDFKIASATGSFTSANNLSQERALREKISKEYVTASTVYPNPTAGNVTLQINAAKAHIAKIVLVGVNGKQLFERKYNLIKGSNQAVLSLGEYAKGTYIAALYNADNVLTTLQKIEKQ